MIGMAKRSHYKGTGYNVMKIFRTLQDAHAQNESFLTVSEIARRCGIHKWTVSRTLDLYMQALAEVVQPEELEAIGLQAKLVKLKNPDLKPQQIVKYLKLRREINQ
jgi:DNA-binding IclR family transcriptional regulator